MISPKIIRFFYWGIILCSFWAFFAIIYPQEHFSFEIGILYLFIFFPLYLLLPIIKIRIVKKILITLELLLVIALFLFGFYLIEYKFGEYLSAFLLFTINIFLRTSVLLNSFTIKHPLLTSLISSILICVSVYYYGTTDSLRIGF